LLANLKGSLYEEKIIKEIKLKAKPNKKEITKEQAEKLLKEENDKHLKEHSYVQIGNFPDTTDPSPHVHSRTPEVLVIKRLFSVRPSPFSRAPLISAIHRETSFSINACETRRAPCPRSPILRAHRGPTPLAPPPHSALQPAPTDREFHHGTQ
ncbi:MAG: hypothetical protein QF767_12895, partial [Alphaproteobacteria bacterium]|nr:hypothetical protein [Alphaproteobacteria bacterium]